MHGSHSEEQSQRQTLQCEHLQHVEVCNGAYTIGNLTSFLAC